MCFQYIIIYWKQSIHFYPSTNQKRWTGYSPEIQKIAGTGLLLLGPAGQIESQMPASQPTDETDRQTKSANMPNSSLPIVQHQS